MKNILGKPVIDVTSPVILVMVAAEFKVNSEAMNCVLKIVIPPVVGPPPFVALSYKMFAGAGTAPHKAKTPAK